MKDLDVFYHEVLQSFTAEITDKVFLHIQNDPELMKRYRTLVNEKSLNQVNSGLGKAVKAYFALENTGREHVPQSILIDSYETHAKS